MKVLLTGAGGGLGSVVQQVAAGMDKVDLRAFSRTALDITDGEAVAEALIAHKPDYVINAAAFTHVDKAETQRKEAFLLNACCLEPMTKACQSVGAVLVHISTDYVFDGNKHTPYTEEDPAHPINVYGASKREGEVAVLAYEKGVVIRTSWIYSLHSKNFLAAIPHLLRSRTDVLRIEDSQKNSPTYAPHLADALFALMNKGISHGLFHYTNTGGGCTRYEFACAVKEKIYAKKPGAVLAPIEPFKASTAEQSGLARRPLYSVMSAQKIADLLELDIPHWQSGIDNLIL
ncbi:MAG: dTDP-4-dehydrorhamnose reductase [Bacteroidales bacterium]|jgi:dTDP-4-dehydrorhamnose reductase